MQKERDMKEQTFGNTTARAACKHAGAQGGKDGTKGTLPDNVVVANAGAKVDDRFAVIDTRRAQPVDLGVGGR